MENILQKIKQGKKNHKIIEFPGTDEKVALVILSSNEIAEARLKADEYIEKFNINDDGYKEIAIQQHIIYRALRDKDNREKQLASNFDEFIKTVDNQEVQYLMVEYSLLTTETSPFVNAVDEQTFEQLKKTLEKMNLSDLNGPSLIALRNFLMTLV